MFEGETGMMSGPKMVIYGGASVDGRLTIAPGVLLMFGDRKWDSIAGSDEETANWLREKHKPQAYLEGSGSLVTNTEKPKPLSPFKGEPRKRDNWGFSGLCFRCHL